MRCCGFAAFSTDSCIGCFADGAGDVCVMRSDPRDKAALAAAMVRITANIRPWSLIANLDADFDKKASSILGRGCQSFNGGRRCAPTKSKSCQRNLLIDGGGSACAPVFQFAVEEIQLGMIRVDPTVPHEKIVDLVGKDNLFKLHALLAKHGN